MSRARDDVRARLASTLAKAAVPWGVACALLVTTPARAASLTAVTGWATTSVPSYVTMYEYVPAAVAANPPVVVAVHYCSGNAAGEFSTASGIVSAANQYGFVMIFPQTSNNCWDVGSLQSLTRDGGGDTQAIVEMVQYAIAKHGADPNRVYVTGSSSGGMMTEALLALYPDVFKAGAEFSGVPAGCWADNYNASNQWSNPCANGMFTQTAQQWGDMVRAMDPGYSGYRPRIQLWHGDMDTTISYTNLTEGIKEWTNVFGLSATPTATDTPMSGYTRQSWQDSCGFTVLEAWTQTGGGHPTPVDPGAVVSWFGLDKSGPDPQVTECDAGASASSGGSSSGGSSTGASSNRASNGDSGSAGCSCRVPTGRGPTGAGAAVAAGLLGLVARGRHRRRW
jgi:poly(hydroxyalkanoate) depolymerase family esterase